jgi:hypothetical protein
LTVGKTFFQEVDNSKHPKLKTRRTQMAVFTTPEQQNAFVAALRIMYLKNEANPGQWYVFSNAGVANSGYSFGQAQWDVGSNPEARDFLASLVNADGARAFSDADIANLQGGNVGQTELNAYSTILSQHSAEVDNFFEQRLNSDVQLVESIVSELRASGDPYQAQVADYITNNRDAQMLLVDYNNQYGISGVDGIGNAANDGLLMQFLKGLAVTPDGIEVRPDGEFSLSDMVRFLTNTLYAHNNPADVLS